MRRERKRRHSEELGEPEILPMMNVLFMLVMVLMGMSAFLPLGVISTKAPRLSSGSAASGAAQQGLGLKVMLLKTGINISVKGSLLPGENNPLIPKIIVKNREAYDFASLQAKLIELKKQYPSEESIMLLADPDVIYDDIVHVMDASREASGQILFPDVAFSPGMIQ